MEHYDEENKTEINEPILPYIPVWSPNQTFKLVEPKDKLYKIEKGWYKPYAPLSISMLTKIYPYTNPYIQTAPVFKSNKAPEIYSISISSDASTVCAGYSTGEIHFFNIKESTRQIVHTNMETILSIKHNPINNHVLLSWGTSGDLTHTDIQTGKVISKIKVLKDQTEDIPPKKLKSADILTPHQMSISNDGEMFAIGYSEGDINIFDEQTQCLSATWNHGTSFTGGHINQVESIAFNHDLDYKNVIVTGGKDRRVILWDVRKRKTITSIIGAYITGDCVDCKSGKIVTGSYDTSRGVEIYDMRKMNNCWQSIEIGTRVYCCKFIRKRDVDMIGVCGYKRNMIKWLTIEGNNKWSYYSGADGCDSPVYSWDSSMGGIVFTYGCGDGSVRLANI